MTEIKNSKTPAVKQTAAAEQSGVQYCTPQSSVQSNGSLRKIFLPAMVLIPSFYYSLSFTSGIVIGYVLCKIFCNIFVNNGKIDSIFIDYGKWKFHLHHWIMGVIILAIVWVIDYFYLPTFFAGAICGMIIQDIYDYNDWHKVILKNPEYSKKEIA